MAYEARLEIGVDSRDAKRDVDGLDDSLGRVEKSGDRADKATRRFGKGARSTAMELNRLRTVAIGFVGAIGGAAALRSIVRASDTYTNLRSQLRLVTDSQEELNQVYDQTFRLAQDTRQDLEGTVGLYARLARSTDELGLSNSDLLTITRAVNQSFVISGASAEEAAGAVRQLSQGMASGTLRGDELNSVMENSPRLARAIAEQMGVTIGELRKLGADGAITAEAISSALIGAADDIDREFQTMERTVGQAMQQLRNDVLNALGPTETAPLVDAVDELRALVADPTFRENIVSITSAAIKGFGFAAEKISDFSGELQNLGLIDSSDTQKDLAAINAEIERIESKGFLGRIFENPFADGSGTIVPGLDVILDKRKLSVLKDRREEILRAMFRPDKEQADKLAGEILSEMAGAAAGSGGIAPGLTEKELKAQEKALQQVIDAAAVRTQSFRDAAEADREAEQARADALEDVRASLRSEEEAIQASYERRLQIVLENTRANSEVRLQLEKELAEQRNQQLMQLERQRQIAVVSSSAYLFDSLAGLAEAFGKKQSNTYKTLFALSKGFAVADASLRLSMAIAQAMADPSALTLPQKLANYAAVASTMGNLVNTISSIQYGGSFDGGGFTGIGPRSGGIDGKGGFPAILHPNETVIDHTKGQKAPAAPQAPIKIVNVMDRSVVGDYLSTDAGEQMVVNIMQKNRSA